MDVDSIFVRILVMLAAVIFLLLAMLLFSVYQERMLMLDCLNNGGHWLTNYAIGCTYPMG